MGEYGETRYANILKENCLGFVQLPKLKVRNRRTNKPIGEDLKRSMAIIKF